MSFPKLYSTFAKYYDRLESQYRNYEMDSKWIDYVLNNSTRVIDISCGTGNHVSNLAKETSFELYAMDASREMVSIASKKNEVAKKTQFIISDFLQLPLKRASFDGAICMYWSLAGLNETQVQTLFAEVNSILTPGGKFVFDVENSEGIKENLLDAPFIDSFFTLENDSQAVIRANLSRKIQRDVVDWRAYYMIETNGVSELFEDRMNLRFYSRSQLERLLENSGFKVEQVLSGPFKIYEIHSPSLYFVASKNKD